jgi:mono/diheme cytochrome c family protein
MKNVLWTLVVTFVVAIIAVIIGVYSGAFNVAAASSGNRIIDWMLSTTMVHSVRSRASRITVPQIDDSSLVDQGFDHYREMCISCHGSPAGGRSEAGVGLNPPAPELSEAARDWSPAELYWIVKNGVRMTGMPAFGPTHSEQELWAMVAFLQKLKSMQASEYRAFSSKRSTQADDHEEKEQHDHQDHQ